MSISGLYVFDEDVLLIYILVVDEELKDDKESVGSDGSKCTLDSYRTSSVGFDACPFSDVDTTSSYVFFPSVCESQKTSYFPSILR